ncbi:MAG: hypothetical protein NVSMB64_02890 [Candidatus Velthaea sp.]
MNNIMTHLRLETDAQQARTQIALAVEQALESGGPEPRLTVTVTGDSLPAQTIAALILALRKLRERGGGIVVEAECEGARQALRVTGLDRIFAAPLTERELTGSRASAVRRTGFAGVVRAAVAGLAAAVALSSGPARAQTPDVPVADAAAIISRIIERNPNLSSYQSRLHVDFRMTSFPFFRQHLDGSTYFKRPANYEVVFDRVPSYAKGFEKLYSDIGDPSNWEKRFAITYVGEAAFENRKDVELRLVQRVRGMIDHEVVFVDPGAWTIDKMEYHYYNGGTIAMTQHFSSVGGYHMLVSQEADINIPHVRAVAHGNYDDYKTNVAIDDAVFSKNK